MCFKISNKPICRKELSSLKSNNSWVTYFSDFLYNRYVVQNNWNNINTQKINSRSAIKTYYFSSSQRKDKEYGSYSVNENLTSTTLSKKNNKARAPQKSPY